MRGHIRSRRAADSSCDWTNDSGVMMTTKFTISFSLWVLAVAVITPAYADTDSTAPETTIWFDAAAKEFTESSPMGNGRLGAMMFGGVDDERIVLNESSVWSGSRQDADRRVETHGLFDHLLDVRHRVQLRDAIRRDRAAA